MQEVFGGAKHGPKHIEEALHVEHAERTEDTMAGSTPKQ